MARILNVSVAILRRSSVNFIPRDFSGQVLFIAEFLRFDSSDTIISEFNAQNIILHRNIEIDLSWRIFGQQTVPYSVFNIRLYNQWRDLNVIRSTCLLSWFRRRTCGQIHRFYFHIKFECPQVHWIISLFTFGVIQYKPHQFGKFGKVITWTFWHRSW